jgi:hypothetical protein
MSYAGSQTTTLPTTQNNPAGRTTNSILGQFQSAGALPSQGSILGVADYNPHTSGGGGAPTGALQNGGWYNGQQYWAPGQGPQQPTGGSGGGNSNLPSINDLYQPSLDFLNNMGTQLNDTKSTQLTGLNTQYTGKQKTIGDQTTGLQQQLQGNHTTFDQQLQSAYAQAAKDYDALSQRNSARYGGQSSAGDAANQLLGNTYLTSRQGLANEGLQGNQLFDQQGTAIKQWSDEQNNNLDQWLSQAQDQVNSVFQQGMNQINADKASTEENKTQAKLGLLQQVVNHQQALQDYDAQLRGQVQAAMAMQGFQGNAYNTQPFLNNIQNLSQGMGQNTSALAQLAQTAGLPQQQAQNFNYQYSFPQTKSPLDQFNLQQIQGK